MEEGNFKGGFFVKILKKLMLVTISILLLGSIIFPTGSSAQSQTTNVQEELIKKADKHITLRDNLFSIINEEELLEVLTDIEFETVINLIEEANSNIQDINLSLDNVNVVDNSVIIKPENEALDGGITLLKEGKRAIKFHWWGVEIWLTKTDVRAISKAGVVGGITYLSGLFGKVGGAVAGAIVSTIISEYITGVAIHAKYYYATRIAIVVPQ